MQRIKDFILFFDILFTYLEFIQNSTFIEFSNQAPF